MVQSSTNRCVMCASEWCAHHGTMNGPIYGCMGYTPAPYPVTTTNNTVTVVYFEAQKGREDS